MELLHVLALHNMKTSHSIQVLNHFQNHIPGKSRKKTYFQLFSYRLAAALGHHIGKGSLIVCIDCVLTPTDTNQQLREQIMIEQKQRYQENYDYCSRSSYLPMRSVDVQTRIGFIANLPVKCNMKLLSEFK